jgi:hypothetical protein
MKITKASSNLKLRKDRLGTIRRGLQCRERREPRSFDPGLLNLADKSGIVAGMIKNIDKRNTHEPVSH